MWHASSESLMCRFSCWSRMVTSLQSTLWPALHACSANADELKSSRHSPPPFFPAVFMCFVLKLALGCFTVLCIDDGSCIATETSVF